MTRRFLIIAFEETDEQQPIEAEGADADELSRIVDRQARPLAKCRELLELLPRAAGGNK
ncbi:MAG TPA: hypothetical protein VM686_10225 [Polyangiaceae bacterium]|jgi:hypothetical protein|nr:hypothetical protein [Polyangiaceae bacterium]